MPDMVHVRVAVGPTRFTMDIPIAEWAGMDTKERGAAVRERVMKEIKVTANATLDTPFTNTSETTFPRRTPPNPPPPPPAVR